MRSKREQSTEPLAPEPIGLIDDLSELASAGRLTDVEQFAVERIYERGEVTFLEIKRRFPGYFLASRASLERMRGTYVPELLKGIREKL